MKIIQCQVWHEAWSHKITKHTNFECTRCKREKSCPKKFSKDNNMIPSPVPLELQNLNQCEDLLCLFYHASSL